MSPKKTRQTIDISQTIPAKELSSLLTISNALATSLDLPVVLQTAIDSAVDVLRLDTGAIYVLEAEQLFLGATTPPLALDQRWLLLQPESLQGHPHLREALMFGRPTYLTDALSADLSPAEEVICRTRNLRTLLFMPLMSDKKAIGALILGTTQQIRSFSEHELDLCHILSCQIALAVANAKLYKSVQDSNAELVHSYDTTLLGWSLALELRDQDTQGHTQRVTRLTEELARKMGIAGEDLNHIHRGALLHDIGKMGIPDRILKKAGVLTDEERAIIQKHTEYAYQFLKKIDYLAPAMDIPYCHHEKWDGSGYPRGLKGEAIPLAARIFAVVDVYDALTSDRPYRPAWPVEDALQYIQEQAGKHFDPGVVSVFLQELIGKTMFE